ncbi:hypothetical protein [Ensifer adhaerens]|uniref:hypothetical protein n=1 Tax=Ensifer adhaerens TaxID=106592 RepID=UPI00069F0A12|nr:hypothetical protein [Ensifer adhaerens]
MHDDRRELLAVPELDDEDMAALLAALAGGSSRVERCRLKDRVVWIKRYQRLEARLGQRLQWLASRLTGATILRPAPILDPQGMLDREVRQITAFSTAGFKTPHILYRGMTALALSHLGLSFFTRLLPLARFLLRIQNGHDLMRFVAATDYLASATQSQS